MIQPAHAPHGPLHVLIDSTGLQVYGAGQWLEAKHGAKSRRTWRKLHLAVDAASGMIVAQTLTDQDVDDPSQVGPLLDQIDAPIGRVTADGAYDGTPIYQMIAAHGDGITVVTPPRSTAVPGGEPGSPTQRDRHLAMIGEQGRMAWQAATEYGRRSLGGNDDGPLQGADRTTAAGPRLRRPADRGCHRRGGAEPDAGGRTDDSSVASQSWCSSLGLGASSPRICRVHQRPSRALEAPCASVPVRRARLPALGVRRAVRHGGAGLAADRGEKPQADGRGPEGRPASRWVAAGWRSFRSWTSWGARGIVSPCASMRLCLLWSWPCPLPLAARTCLTCRVRRATPAGLT